MVAVFTLWMDVQTQIHDLLEIESLTGGLGTSGNPSGGARD